MSKGRKSKTNICANCYEVVNHKCECGNKITKKGKKCVVCFQLSRHIVERPPKEQLLKEIKELGYCGT